MSSPREDLKEILAEALVAYAKAELQPVMSSHGVVGLLPQDVLSRATRLCTAKYSCMNKREQFLIDCHVEQLLDTLFDILGL